MSLHETLAAIQLHENAGEAADLLGISRPAVTGRLDRAVEYLGVPALYFTKRGVDGYCALSPSGETLLAALALIRERYG